MEPMREKMETYLADLAQIDAILVTVSVLAAFPPPF